MQVQGVRARIRRPSTEWRCTTRTAEATLVEEMIPVFLATRWTCSLAASTLLAMLVLAPGTSLAAENGAQLTLRPFCQADDEAGHVSYLAVTGSGFPASSEGTFSATFFPDLPRLYDFGPNPVSTDSRGEIESSIGWGLSGLGDDIYLGKRVTVTIEIAGVAASATTTLGCDVAANAPANKDECHVEVYLAFWRSLGEFKNRGACIAFVAKHRRK